MPSLHLGELPLGWHIHLSYSLTGLLLYLVPKNWSTQCYWKFQQELFPFSPCWSDWVLLSRGLSFYVWPALSQWITMRQMRLERDTLLFGFLVSGDIVWHAEFWWDVELSGCPFVLESALIFPFLTAQLRSNLSFPYGTAQDKRKILYRFIKDRIQVYRRIQYRVFQRVTTRIRNSRVCRDRAHYANEGGSQWRCG